MAEKRKTDIESCMIRLEEIVKEMEEEKLPLDKSLKLYEEGIFLVRTCTERLEKAEQKVKMLQLRADGQGSLVDFDQGEE
jgi:exodeoxyribonuclease VII small subunit